MPTAARVKSEFSKEKARTEERAKKAAKAMAAVAAAHAAPTGACKMTFDNGLDSCTEGVDEAACRRIADKLKAKTVSWKRGGSC